MAKENVSDLDFVDDFHFPALFDNEENQEDFTEAKHAEEMQFQVGCVIISKMNKDNPSSVLMTEALPEPNHQEDGQPSHSFCDICAERKESNQMFSTDKCVHSYCSDCISKHVAAKIQESITVVTCPGLNCKAVLELETCRIKLNKGVIDLWEDALCQELISVSQRFYCPYKDCSAMLVNDKEGQEISEAECPFCHRLFCARCHVPWHSGVDCEVFQKLNEDERGREDLMVMELARDQKWSRCPQCKFYVERTEGCPHMTCRL
ncbi:E3 ubiquitin-protein ligase RSL1 isoform X2 [Hevea brasiliensis]|uniref:E3 ubiquitin-protein ligase RSL1 isoform X2 n=1 Tax=Hevea brasiliensis TaxID=3981 RepID=UPI0025FEFD84|nr:E3 ubiquitin-protein ligase RSL1 isoform X2 [Hevea brasiliensis]